MCTNVSDLEQAGRGGSVRSQSSVADSSQEKGETGKLITTLLQQGLHRPVREEKMDQDSLGG